MHNTKLSRDLMIKTQLLTCGMSDDNIISAIEEVDRSKFVPEEFAALAYIDDDIPLPAGRNLIDVLSFAKILEAASIKASDNVMVIGCNLGYSIAVIAELATHVTAVEENPELVSKARKNLNYLKNKIEVVTAPLVSGCSAHAPYDVIIIEGAVEKVPSSLLGQLVEGGVLVAVISQSADNNITNSSIGCLTSFHKQGGEMVKKQGEQLSISSLAEFNQKPHFVF